MNQNHIKLEDMEVLAIDCQATSSSPTRGHLLEIGWVRFCASQITKAHDLEARIESNLVKIPKNASLPRQVLNITGIQEKDLAKAPSPQNIWKKLYQTAQAISNTHNRADCPTIIHFCRYEEPLLRNLHQNWGKNEEFPLNFICTHEMVKRLIPGLPRKGLRAVTGYFGHHLSELRRSKQHVVATALIWKDLISLLAEKFSIHTFSGLLAWLESPQPLPGTIKYQREYPMAKEIREGLPDQPGIYRMYRSNGDLLYIGKAKSLKRRVNSYFQKQGRHAEHILEMLSQAKDIKVTPCQTALEAALRESDEIKRFAPMYNRALRERDREICFYAEDLKIHNNRSGPKHHLGPFSSPRHIEPMAKLTALLNQEVKSPSQRYLEKILDIPKEYLPDFSCFSQGVAALKYEYKDQLPFPLALGDLKSLGALLWKEMLKKIEEEKAQAKLDAEKEAADIDLVLETETAEPEAETWTPERVQKVLAALIRYGTFQIRRSLWFCRLSESSLTWSESNPKKPIHTLVVEQGQPAFLPPISSFSDLPLPPGHKRKLKQRQRHFDIFTYDRMRVLTTEIRRLIDEEQTVSLCLHPDVILQNQQLQKMLKWL